jgi:peroxiredoxin
MTRPSLAETMEACARRCREMDAPLSQRLSAFASEVRRLDPVFADVVDRMVNRLQQSHAGAPAPATGEQMPPFVLPDEEGRLVSLVELLKKGPVVVSFHRGHWCPYCRMSADALAEIYPKVEAAGAQLVLITPELQKFTRKLKADVNASFPILSDLDNGYALELSLAIKIDDEKRMAMTQAGSDIARFQDNENWTLPIPATFVIGADGLVMARFVDPDYRKRMDTEDLLDALK